jgi:hypothetical protein
MRRDRSCTGAMFWLSQAVVVLIRIAGEADDRRRPLAVLSFPMGTVLAGCAHARVPEAWQLRRPGDQGPIAQRSQSRRSIRRSGMAGGLGGMWFDLDGHWNTGDPLRRDVSAPLGGRRLTGRVGVA